jgi:glutamate-5-semialdehyde dehydrogenase
MDLKSQMRTLAAAAREASRQLACSSGQSRDAALLFLADLLNERRSAILAANAEDVQAAEKNGLDAARVDRLRITEQGVDGMIESCRHVAGLSDPVGEVEHLIRRPNGLLVGRMRIPLGVIAMIYESRPNVTIDAAILCLKAGNSVILRGGSEARHSNQILGELLQTALKKTGLPPAAAQVVPTTDREAVQHLLALDEFIDVVIPRGGESLIRAVVRDATMPVLKHYQGVCNALECLLVHKRIAAEFLSKVGPALAAEGVFFRACPMSLPLLGVEAAPAVDDDFGREFLSLTLAVKVVDSQSAAEAHIARYGSGHSEAILTRDHARAMRFLRTVDASCVLINASTRFNDGGELGLGAEIGISTSKIHSYGPMGVKELTSQKFIVFGEGQVRE